MAAASADGPNQVSARRMNANVYKAAVEGKADILKGRDDLDCHRTPNNNTLLHIHIGGGMARKDFVLAILNSCPALLRQKNIKGETALHMAAKEGLSDIVKALVEKVKAFPPINVESGEDPVKEMLEMRNKEGDTALHEAVRCRRRDVVKLLIGEQPDLEYSGNNAGETPLYLAVNRGFEELVEEILTTCNSPAHEGPNGLTALHEAIICSQARGSLVRKILEKMPNLATKRDEIGWTPLHYAAYFDEVPIAEVLLKKDDSAAYIADKDGKIPLHIAASRNHIQIMDKIISYCPDCCEMVDNRGWNVLHSAVETRSRKAVEHILKYHWGSNLINEKDVEGNTPLHQFATSPSFMLSLISHPKVDRMAVNKKSLTAMDILSSNNESPLLKGLVQLLFKIYTITDSQRQVKNDDPEERTKDEKVMVSEIKKASKIHLIVAALIATVTYAAGFTLPGGYKEEKGPQRGMAILAQKASFIAFYLTDGIAMLLSSVAVVIHFFMTLHQNKAQLLRMFKWASYSTLLAMGAMLAAFAMAACAVLFNNSGIYVTLAALILSLNFCPIYFVYPLLAKWVVHIARR